jgi:hypothetical protein
MQNLMYSTSLVYAAADFRPETPSAGLLQYCVTLPSNTQLQGQLISYIEL